LDLAMFRVVGAGHGVQFGHSIDCTTRQLQVNTRSAILRGGLLALLIGLPILATPLVIGWLKPGPTDPRVYSNLLLMPVFSIPIFIFGGFIGMFRALSRQARQAPPTATETTETLSERSSEWAHQRTHDGQAAESDKPREAADQ
jgi:hypothetical protein